VNSSVFNAAQINSYIYPLLDGWQYGLGLVVAIDLFQRNCRAVADNGCLRRLHHHLLCHQTTKWLSRRDR